MSQRTKYIDLTRSYLPIDPATLPETMHATEGEDRPEQRMSVIPYEGHNFMPTSYGYRSYFGFNSKLDIDPLDFPEKCREIFIFQKNDLSNMLVALCDDGIWTKQGESSGAWTHNVLMDDLSHYDLENPDAVATFEWSYCIIANELFVYRQGHEFIYKCSEETDYVFADIEPSTLNMAGQMGIFKAGARLGAWDSDNAVGHSGFDNKADFTPNIGTGANITKINDVKGKIVNVLQHDTGFIVYATKSIVGVKRNLANQFGWEAKAISIEAGIAYRRQAVIAEPDNIHYAWTSIGLMRIENFQAEIIAPELYDYLKENQDPIYLKFLQGRHLAICLSNDTYVEGHVSFYTQTVGAETREFKITEIFNIVSVTFPDPADNVSWPDNDQAQAVFLSLDQFPAYSHQAMLGNKPRTSDIDYGNYEDHFFIPLSSGQVADLKKDFEWSTTEVTVNGTAVKLETSVLPYLSTGILPAAYHLVSANEGNFYTKCRAIWDTYNTMAQSWLAQLEERLESLGISIENGAVTEVNAASDPVVRKLPIKQSNFTANADVTAPSIKGFNSELYPDGQGANAANGAILTYVLNYNMWLEYSKTGEMYFTVPHPLNQRTISVKVEPSYGRYIFPMEGRITDVVGAVIGGIDGVLNAKGVLGNGGIYILPDETALDNFLTTLGDKTFWGSGSVGSKVLTLQSLENQNYLEYVNKAGVQQKADDLYMTKVAWHYTDDQPNDYSFNIEIYTEGLESADKITITNVETDMSTGVCSLGGIPSYSYPSSYYRFTSKGKKTDSPNVPAELEVISGTAIPNLSLTESSCIINGGNQANNDIPRLLGMGFGILEMIYDINIGDLGFTNIEISQEIRTRIENFTYPPVSFLMQVGSPVPYDIEWKGAYVYDSHYKKWGKIKGPFRHLLDFAPINSTALGTVPYTNFGVQGAILNSEGEIRLFDAHPEDSKIKIGKWGLFRHGYTVLESLRADFRQKCSGTLQVESSLDGQSVEAGIVKEYEYSDVTQIVQGVGNSGRWHNVVFIGQFDISYLECTGWTQGRR